MKFYGDGSEERGRATEHAGLMTFRPYHTRDGWPVIWFPASDFNPDRVEEWLWKDRLEQMDMIRKNLD